MEATRVVFQNTENPFADRAIDRHGVKLLRPADAAQYVARCAEHGIEVLGIDGFRVDGYDLQPLMEHSIDLSLSSAQGDHRAEAADFLSGRIDSDLWFEVVVDK